MIMVDPSKHTKNERLVMAMAINRCGSGNHPAADEETLNFFACDYTLECLEGAAKALLNDDGKAVAHNAMATLRLCMLPTVAKVTCKRHGSGWQYIAHTDGGEEIVIRKHATKRYDYAFMYQEEVATGNKRGLTRHFTFGKKESRYHATSLMAKYQVEEV